ncbi:MAG: hypothetical protein HXX12_04510 [Geothrix sp.]|uniref:hypothetical protein n=1 Tax=Geothrix sp. TaxID=1962974 RepID=UPI0017B181E7|nr:hypothetical protein [Geothrix sp.]NWJ40217.1 hypothetical protein [Geothrix sp.]WIL21777.1 MAG: hypothetical protein QOZ81_001048 [Geothrix sp.]
MCSATLYRQRQFEMDPTEAATVTIVVLGDWEIQGPKGKSQCLPPGRYKLIFTPRSMTSLKLIVIDPDPGGGRP